MPNDTELFDRTLPIESLEALLYSRRDDLSDAVTSAIEEVPLPAARLRFSPGALSVRSLSVDRFHSSFGIERDGPMEVTIKAILMPGAQIHQEINGATLPRRRKIEYSGRPPVQPGGLPDGAGELQLRPTWLPSYEQLIEEAVRLEAVIPRLEANIGRQQRLGLGDLRPEVERQLARAAVARDKAYLARYFRPVDPRSVPLLDDLRGGGRRFAKDELPGVIRARVDSRMEAVTLPADSARDDGITWQRNLWQARIPLIPPVALEAAEFAREITTPYSWLEIAWKPTWDLVVVEQRLDPALLAVAGDAAFLLWIWGNDQAVLEELML